MVDCPPGFSPKNVLHYAAFGGMGVSENQGYLLGVPFFNCSLWGSILHTPHFEKLPCRLSGLGFWKLKMGARVYSPYRYIAQKPIPVLGSWEPETRNRAAHPKPRQALTSNASLESKTSNFPGSKATTKLYPKDQISP